MGAKYPLNTGKAVSLAPVSGVVRGSVALVPPGTERWHITRYAIVTNQSASSTTVPVCSIYTESISDLNLVDSTFTGNRDSGDCDIWLEKGQPIIAEWVDGVNGSIATLSLFGERELY